MLQEIELPPDVQYFMDCAAEHSHITGATYAAISMFGDRTKVREIIDQNEGVEAQRGWWHRNGKICRDLSAYSVEIVSGLPVETGRGLACIGYLRLRTQITELAECMASWNFDDTTRGGALQPFLDVVRCDRDYNPTPRAARTLYAPKAIRRYVKSLRHDDSAAHLAVIVADLKKMPVPHGPRDADLIWAMMDQQREAQRRERARMIMHARFMNGAKPYTIKKDQRKAIRRAAAVAYVFENVMFMRSRFAVMVLGQTAVSAFAAGEPIQIKGEKVTFEMTRTGSLIQNGHGSLTIGVLSPEGSKLGNLCVYVEKTPVLDQIAAFALHVSAGEEDTILNTGNLYSVTAEGADHPIITSRIKKVDPEHVTMTEVRFSDHTRRLDAQRRYFEETGPLYADALATIVCGRDKKFMMGFNKSGARS